MIQSDLKSPCDQAVQALAAFMPDNDPYGERDFGAFDLAGQRLFWKIDYYDRDLRAGSENPARSGRYDPYSHDHAGL